MTAESNMPVTPRGPLAPNINAKSLHGSNLLATLHSQMEHMKMAVRLCRAASKKPHSRTKQDISLIMSETSKIPLLTRNGPAVHRDLCHVMQAVQLQQMQSLKLPSDFKSAAFVHVIAGSLQIRTKDLSGFDETTDANMKTSSASDSSPDTSIRLCAGQVTADTANTASGGAKSSLRSTTGAACPSTSGQCDSAAIEEELKALFTSIDADGSGAIDVEELQYALGVMGIAMTAEQVQELMDSVDKDGSGELEFEEFQQILTSKLGQSGSAQTTWQQLPDGSWGLQLTHGGFAGEVALTQAAAQKGLLLALEDCSLLVLTATDYQSILLNGFDGQLNAKLSVLKCCSALMSCISSNSDIRGLAYAAVCEQHGWGGHVYAAGQVPQALYVLQEGSCRVVAQVSYCSALGAQASTAAIPAAAPSADGNAGRVATAAAAAAALVSSPRCGLHSPRQQRTSRRVDVAVLGPGDVAGEAALLGMSQHTSSALVSSAHLTVLRLDLDDITALLHPADLQRLKNLLDQREVRRQQRSTVAAAALSPANTRKSHFLQPVASVSDTDVQTESVNLSVNKSTESREQVAGASAVIQSVDVVHSVLGYSSTRQLQPNPQLGSTSGSMSGRKAWLVSDSGAAVRSTLNQQILWLPSTAGGAADVVSSAAGSTPRTMLPSKLEKNKALAAQQLLHHLVAQQDELRADIDVQVSSAVAALVTSRGSRSMPGCTSGSLWVASSAPGNCRAQCNSLPRRQQGSASGSGDTSTAALSSADLLSGHTSTNPRRSLASCSCPGVMNSSRSRGNCGKKHCQHHSKIQVRCIGDDPPEGRSAAADTAAPNSVTAGSEYHTMNDTSTRRSSKSVASSAEGLRQEYPCTATSVEQKDIQQQTGGAQHQPAAAGTDKFFLEDIDLQPWEAPFTAAASIAAQVALSSNSIQLHSSPGTARHLDYTAQGHPSGALAAMVASGYLSASGDHNVHGTNIHSSSICLSSRSGASQAGAVTVDCSGCTASGSGRQLLTARSSLIQPSMPTVRKRSLSLSGSLPGSATAGSLSADVFCMFEPGTWAATQAATVDASWVMQRQLKQQHGSLQQVQRQPPHSQAHDSKAVAPAVEADVQQSKSIDGSKSSEEALAAAQAGTLNPAEAVGKSKPQLARQLQEKQDAVHLEAMPKQCQWSAKAHAVPRLLLYKLQQQQVTYSRQPNVGPDNMSAVSGSYNRAQSPAFSHSATSPSEEATAALDQCAAGDTDRASSAGDTIVQQHDGSAGDATGPEAVQRIRVTRQLSGRDKRSDRSSKALMTNCADSNKRQSQQQHQPMLQRQVQQCPAMLCPALLPAPLPQFTSALTRRWRPNGRFNQTLLVQHGSTLSLSTGPKRVIEH